MPRHPSLNHCRRVIHRRNARYPTRHPYGITYQFEDAETRVVPLLDNEPDDVVEELVVALELPELELDPDVEDELDPPCSWVQAASTSSKLMSKTETLDVEDGKETLVPSWVTVTALALVVLISSVSTTSYVTE